MAVMAAILSRIPVQEHPAMLYELAGLLYEHRSCQRVEESPCWVVLIANKMASPTRATLARR